MKLSLQRRDAGSVLDESVRLKGDLEFEGALRIEGTLIGSVTSTGHLTVGSGARVDASVRAGRVTVQGTLAGEVTGQERVEIGQGGVITGDVSSPQFIIGEGGRFEGTSLRSVEPRDVRRSAEAAREKEDEADRYSVEVRTG